jgi:hypothetical protein
MGSEAANSLAAVTAEEDERFNREVELAMGPEGAQRYAVPQACLPIAFQNRQCWWHGSLEKVHRRSKQLGEGSFGVNSPHHHRYTISMPVA